MRNHRQKAQSKQVLPRVSRSFYTTRTTHNERHLDLLAQQKLLVKQIGRGGETRTPGLLVPNQARYQLRHTPLM